VQPVQVSAWVVRVVDRMMRTGMMKKKMAKKKKWD